MENIYWIHQWAKIRQDEVVRLPEELIVHQDFLRFASKTDFDTAFKEIWSMYISIYGDIAKEPEAFSMPLFRMDEFNSFTTQARDSRGAAYRPFMLLYNLLISGELINGDFIINATNFRAVNKVKNLPILLEKFSDYGIFFEGLNNYKITGTSFSMLYPDNETVLTVLKLMAEKAHVTNRINDFLCCHYKLFQEDRSTANYGYGADVVADKMHTKEEQEFIFTLDAELKQKGYFSQIKSWNEGPGYAYYDKESIMRTSGPYHYWLLSWKTKLILYLRIRNALKCMEYLKQCPDSVKQIFLYSDDGCEKRQNGTCQFGQEYTIDKTTYWRCGCCNAPFQFSPIKEDIPHYIKLIELGLNK